MQMKFIGKPTFWFLALVTSLTAIYMTLLIRVGDQSHFGVSILFGVAISSSLWDRRQSFHLDSNLLSRTLGSILILAVLVISPWLLANIQAYPKSTPATNLNELSGQVFALLRLMPFLAGLGIALLATRLAKVWIYWRELVLVFFVGVPSILINSTMNFSPITAWFSALLLSSLGFDATLTNDIFIILPGGAVKVDLGCSGIDLITYCLGISIIFLIMFPIARKKVWVVPLVAMGIAFLVNTVRVALLAVLVSSQNQEAFKYWHQGSSSLMFSLISVIIFAIFYLFLSRQNQRFISNPHSAPSALQKVVQNSTNFKSESKRINL